MIVEDGREQFIILMNYKRLGMIFSPQILWNICNLTTRTTADQYRTVQFSPRQSTEDVLDIGVVPPRLGDGHPQLRVAERANGCDNSSANPDNDGHAHWAGILQDPLRAHKNPWSNDVSWV